MAGEPGKTLAIRHCAGITEGFGTGLRRRSSSAPLARTGQITKMNANGTKKSARELTRLL